MHLSPTSILGYLSFKKIKRFEKRINRYGSLNSFVQLQNNKCVRFYWWYFFCLQRTFFKLFWIELFIITVYFTKRFRNIDLATHMTILNIFQLFFQYFRYKQYKLLWDESWIIDFGDIKPGKAIFITITRNLNISPHNKGKVILYFVVKGPYSCTVIVLDILFSGHYLKRHDLFYCFLSILIMRIRWLSCLLIHLNVTLRNVTRRYV